ncbi:44001_t:CDS:2 [Gigaspora margarita]|uniref:44001_t:CDS:1 n=1 Tax=Gigaspora margarita TaxID=4874 RepID=A0ABN7VA91_GIGMA|nr:44001_t:CDS:2 [Gigaspora margarita]
MRCISPNIKEESKVTVLGSVVGKDIACSLLKDMWKTKRLSTTILQAATGTNRWVISSDLNSEVEVEVSAYCMKFVTAAITNDGENNNVAEALNASEPETDISSNSKHSMNEEIGVSNRDNALSYHDILSTRSSANCRGNTRHVDFHKQLVNSIFAYYSNGSVVDQVKKKKKQDNSNPNITQHYLFSLRNDPETSKLKGKCVQRCLKCYKRATTCCTCLNTRALCMNCWVNYIRNMYNSASTK